MTLRKKTLIIIGITLIGLIAILYGTSRTILLRSFSELETQNVNQNVKRALSVLSESIADLGRSTADWAAWDDTYAFIENANEDYIKTNLVDGTFSELRINLILFVNSSGEIIFGKGFDLIDNKELPIPKSFLEHLSAHQTLLQHLDIKSTKGIVLLPDGPLVLSSHPIVTSEDEGPIRGTLLMGRYLDSREIGHLAETLHLSLTIHQFEDSQTLPDLQTIKLPMLKESPVLIRPFNEHSVVGYALLNDIYGEPALVLRVDMPREIYKQAQTSLAYYLYSFIGLGLAFIMITLFILEKMVLSRLARLHSDVTSIGTSIDLYEGVSLPGKDEFSGLADRINGMLEALRESQRSLLESEERYRLLFEQSPIGISLTSPDEKVVSGNKAMESITGYSIEELKSINLADTYENPGDRKSLLEALRLYGSVVNFPVQLKRKDGTPYDALLNISRVHYPGGKDLFQEICIDVTERKKMEEALREKEKRYDLATRSGHVGVWDWNLKTSEIYLDPTLKAMLGYEDHEIRNHIDDWTQYVHPDDMELVMAEAKAHFDGLTPQYEVTHRMLHRDGSIRWFLARGTAIRDETGKPIRVLGTDTDITERKYAEDALKKAQEELELRVQERTTELSKANEELEAEITNRIRAEKALRESEERFRTLFEFAPDGYYLIDLEGTFIDGNKIAEKIVGYKKEELTGKSFLKLNLLAPGQIPGAAAALEKNRRGKPTGPDEFLLNRKDGTQVPVEISTLPVSFKGQTLVLSIARDITGRKETERVLKKREKELELKTRDLEEVNVALRVLLKKKEEDKKELEEKVLANVKEVVNPYVEKLKGSGLTQKQLAYTNILQSNLRDIISPFSRAVSSGYLNLTPMEIQVANLVKQGKTTKEISVLVNLSKDTIGFHRRNIREKLGIKGKKANLRTHLLSIPE
jgi:PAS domain S-box-containing protein